MGKGLYVAVKYTDRSLNELKKNVLDKFDIPNPISTDKIHTTIIYSKKYAIIDNEEYKIVKPVATIKSFEVWKTQDKNSALVAKLDAPDLIRRHKELMSNYDLDYSHDKFNPHITLSYNVPDDYVVPKITAPITLIVDHEYQEDLIEDWAKDK